MKKNLLEIYALAVCFVTIVCAVCATGIGLYDLLEISKPEFTMSAYTYQRHQTNDAFIQDECKEIGKKKLSEEKKTQLRLASYERALKTEQRDAIQSLVKVLIILSLDGLLFWLHWGIARRSRIAAKSE